MYIYATVGSRPVFDRLTLRKFLDRANHELPFKHGVSFGHLVTIERIVLESHTVSPDDTQRLFAIIAKLDSVQDTKVILSGTTEKLCTTDRLKYPLG
jgi:hypothetical protein